MYTLKHIILYVLTLMVLSSCDEMVEGEGDVITRSYDLKPFSGVQMNVPGVLLLNSGKKNITLSTNENIFTWIHLYVSNDILHVELKDDVDIWHFDKLEFKVSMPLISYVVNEGSGDINASGVLLGLDTVYVKVKGSGDIIMDELLAPFVKYNIDGAGNIRCDNFEGMGINAKIEGSGDVNLSGRVRMLQVAVDGSGDFKAYNMICEDAVVDIEGAGDCLLFVNRTLDVEIEGSGSVYYKGNPTINFIKEGSGGVHKVN